MPPYDKSLEKVLTTQKVPDFEDKPDWGGTIVQAVQYADKRPNVVLQRYYTPKGATEEKIMPFVNIPPAAVPRVAELMIKLAQHIEAKFPKQQG
jgi:hypothetical protein